MPATIDDVKLQLQLMKIGDTASWLLGGVHHYSQSQIESALGIEQSGYRVDSFDGFTLTITRTS